MKIDRTIWLLLGGIIFALCVVGLFSLVFGDSTYGWVLLILALGLVVWIVFG